MIIRPIETEKAYGEEGELCIFVFEYQIGPCHFVYDRMDPIGDVSKHNLFLNNVGDKFLCIAFLGIDENNQKSL